MPGEDLSEYYTIPVILSMAGIEKQVNGQLDKVGVTGGQKIGKGLVEGLKSSEADLKRIYDNVGKLQDKAADSVGKLKTAEAGLQDLREKGITSGQRYVRAMAAQEKAQRDATRATKTATDALKDYEDAAKRAENSGSAVGSGIVASLRGAATSASGAGSEAAAGFAEGFAGSSALLRLGAAGGPVGVAVAAVGVALGGILWKNVMAGVDREPGRDLIQGRLGASPEEMAAVGRASGAAYANNFGSSLDENMQAAQLAIQGGLVTGALDPELQGVTEKIEAISQLVGGDLSEVTKSASILLRSGLAGSAEQAFDLIAKGYQVTGDLGADWLDSIGEYASGWKNAGLTGQQALALIKQAQGNGVDVTDRSADALREFGRRVSEEGPKMIKVIDAIGLNGQAMYDKFREGGPEAFQAFDQVFDKIRNIQDPVERNQAALALLGDTAGDFIDAFAKWDPSSAVDALGAVDGAAQQASDTLGGNTAGSIESAKRTLDLAVENVQNGLAEAFGPTLTEVANWVIEHQDDIVNFFTMMGEAAIAGTQDVVLSVGQMTEALGQLIAGVGNTLGALTDANATVQDLLGRDEIADQLRKDAQEYYGWGEALEAQGRAMIDNAHDMDSWKENLRNTVKDTDTATDSVGNLGQSFGKLNTEVDKLPATLPPWMNDLATGTGGIPAGQNPLTGPLGIPGPPTIPGLAPTGGGGRGVGINLQIAANGGIATSSFPWDAVAQAESSGNWQNADTGNNGHFGGLQFSPETWKAFGGGEFAEMPHLATREQQIEIANRTAFTGYQGTSPQGLGAWEAITKGMVPGVTVNTQPGGAASTVGLPDVRGAHPQIAELAAIAQQQFGLTLSAGRDDHDKDGGYHPLGEAGDFSGSAEQMAAFSNYLAQNFGPLLAELIHEGGNTMTNIKDGKPTPIIDQPGSVYTTAQAGNHADHVHVAVTDQQASQFEAAIQQGTTMLSVGQGNTFGAGYQTGTGTPGYNEEGDPGYYQPDPRDIQQASRGVEDATRRIADADQAVIDTTGSLNDAITERDRIAKLSEVERVTQGVDLKKANDDVDRLQKQLDRSRTEQQRSREDAKWAQEDLAEAQQGKFTAAKKSKKGGGGDSELGELGSIASSFLKETFGFGDFLPALDDNPWIKSLDAGLGAFLPMLMGTSDQAGGGAAGGGGGGGLGGLLGLVPNAQTSSAPFGLPDVTAPPMPPDGAHWGSGAQPGPATVNSFDLSTTYQGTVGMDPAELEKRNLRNVQRGVARINGIPMAAGN